MLRYSFILLICINTFVLKAQTGIGTTTPNASAKLDVFSTNKGFLPPRVTLTSATDATTIANPAEGLLVYNVGSVGLQSGYYYWNGSNWATIATAISAGNGVAASDLFKLYHESYSTTSGKAPSTEGYSFTVPVSGRYEFNFNSTGWNANGSTVKLTFNIRQGTTVLGTDFHQSTSSNVWAEYEGRVEVNLIAGITYNVQVVTTTGNRDYRDWDKIMYKLVAGNLPVTGQTVEYGIARYTGADGGSLAAGALVSFDATAAGNLAWSGNKFTLKANKTYEIESGLAIYYGTNAGVAGRFQIYDFTNTTSLASGLFMSQNGSGSFAQNANTPMKCIITPVTDIQVGIRMLDFYGPGGPGIVGSTSVTGTSSSPNSSYFMVKQVGSSAIVNPWVLSGNDVYNTSGEVGIGTATPAASAILDVTSTNKGLLIPRMTASQKSAISSPSTGLLIFQTDAPSGFYYYNGTSWLNISNLGTTNRYIPYSTNFAQYTTGQSLASLALGTYANLTSSDLIVDVPSGFSSNRIVLKWDTWGDVSSSNNGYGSFRFQISQTGTSTATYGSVAMNGWSNYAANSTRFATPVTYILNDLSPGSYTFKLQISREAEIGTITSMNNYHVSGTAQVFVK